MSSHESFFSVIFGGTKQIIVIILSMIFGGIITVIAAAGAITYGVMRVPIGEVANSMVEPDPETGEKIMIFSEEYAKKSVFGLTASVVDMVQNAQANTLTLDQFVEISPVFKAKLEELSDTIANDFSVHIKIDGSDGLLSVPVSDLGDFFGRTLYHLELPALLSAPSINILNEENANYDLLKAICYIDDAPVTFGMIKDDGLMTVLENIELATILGVDENTNGLMKALALDSEGKPRKIGDLMGDQITDIVNSIPLDSVLTVAEDNLLHSIIFNKDGTCKTIGELTSASTDEILNDVMLGDALNIDASSNAVMRTLAYGKEGMDYTIVDGKIEMLGDKKPTSIGDLKTKDTSELIDGVKVSELIGSATTPLMQKISEYTVGELSTLDYTSFRLNEIIEINETSSPLMRKLGPSTIAEFTAPDFIDGIKLSEIIEIDESSPALIQEISAWSIGDLTDNSKFDSLKVKTLFGNDADSNFLLKALPAESTVGSLANDMQNLTFESVFSDEIYTDSTHTTKKGPWKYMLGTDPTATHKISEVDALVTNMTNSISTATLRELNNDGIITTDPTTLEKTLPLSTQKIGDLTIIGIIDVVASLP